VFEQVNRAKRRRECRSDIIDLGMGNPDFRRRPRHRKLKETLASRGPIVLGARGITGLRNPGCLYARRFG